MIPKQEEVKVFSNSSNEKGFTINASREAFRILSSGLYSNKPQAIIRELSCNAYDSHVMAGYPDRPFKVHLPDSWEPFLSIEDFGIGLDDDDINNIYTSYFTSTKTTSNDVIGGLGLGSKTPFSYTDTFTIRTRKDSVERVYNAYVSEAGSPTVSLMSEVDTDLPNGVLITVPVRQADFYDFAREAKKVYEYFKVMPEGFNGDNNIVRELEEGRGLIVNNWGSATVTAVMGNVAYHVRVDETIIPLDRKRAWSFLNKSSLVVRFNIGDLSVAASRETISFDDESKEVFINKIENIVEEYYRSFQVDVDACETVVEALNCVYQGIGEWAWNILDYKGESLATWANKNVLSEIRAILDPENLYVEGELHILTKGYSNQLSTNVLKDKYGEYRLTYKGLRDYNSRFIIFMDDTDHGRTFSTTSRSYIRSTNCKHEILLPFVITDDQHDALDELLGENFDHSITLTEAKEKFKVIREKVKAESGPRKDPVARAKKNEIRIDCWENDSAQGDYEPKRLVDIDELSSKRVGHFVISRGSSEHTILGHWGNNSSSFLIYICKIFKLDYIVMSRPSQTKSVREKMPFLIELSELGRKDIKDNEVAFLYHCLQVFNDSVKSFSAKCDQKNFETLIDNTIFTNYRHSTNDWDNSVVSLSRKVFGNVIIPEITDEVRSKELIDKLKDALEVFNDTEIAFSGSHVSIDSYDNPWAIIYNNYVGSIAQAMYNRNKAVYDKYPLMVALMTEIYYGNDTIIEHVNDYVQMVHERSLREVSIEPFNEAMDELFQEKEVEVNEELYEEVE